MTQSPIINPTPAGAFRVPSRDLSNAAWEELAGALLFIDSSGAVRAFNAKFETLAGADITTAVLESVFPPGCRPGDLLDSGEQSGMCFCEVTPNGEPARPARLEYCKTADGGLLTSVRFEVEPEPQAALDTLNAVLDTADCLIVVVDHRGNFVRFNQAAEILTMLPEQEVRGRPFWDVVLLEEDRAAAKTEFERIVAEVVPATTRNRWRLKDGSTRALFWSHRTISGRGKRVEYVVSTAAIPGPFEASLSREFLDAQSAERKSISRYLHDTVSQNLVVLALTLGKLQRTPKSAGTSEWTQTMSLVDRCCRDLRVITYALAPPVFEHEDAAGSFNWYANHLRDDAGIDVEFQADLGRPEMPASAIALLFAAVQEWAERAIHYRNAGKTVIRLSSENKRLHLTFSCDRPFDAPITGILAARVIRERIREMGGGFETLHEPGGITARLWIPLAEAALPCVGTR